MDRFYTFLPSILALTLIWCISFLIWRTYKRCYGVDTINSKKWLRKNKWKTSFMAIMLSCVSAPAAEELIFRAPIIIMFDQMSSAALYGIYVSSALFALVHLHGNTTLVTQIRIDEEGQSDDVRIELKRLLREKKRTAVIGKIIKVIVTFPMGILFGYYGIKYQSLWVSFGAHSAWNFFMPLVIVLVIGIISVVVYLSFLIISFLFSKVRCITAPR